MIMNLADEVFRQAKHVDPLSAVPSHLRGDNSNSLRTSGVCPYRFPCESPFPEIRIF